MRVYVIAGPNGAGKTTFAREFLPSYGDCKNFVNADLIAQGIAPFSPETVAVRAGRLMLSEIRSLMGKKESFAFETTLSGKSYEVLLQRLKAQGYEITIFFLWIESVDLSLSRVRERVARGGHDVPEPVVRRRFDRSIRNFLTRYRQLADLWVLFDNSGMSPEIIAGGGEHILIMDETYYESLAERYRRE